MSPRSLALNGHFRIDTALSLFIFIIANGKKSYHNSHAHQEQAPPPLAVNATKEHHQIARKEYQGGGGEILGENQHHNTHNVDKQRQKSPEIVSMFFLECKHACHK